MSVGSPFFEKRFIDGGLNGSWKESEIASWLTETGRFTKFFRKQQLIGRGGFGSVFNGWSIFDEK